MYVCVSSWLCLLGCVCVFMGMPVGCVYVYVGGLSLWVCLLGCVCVFMGVPVGCVYVYVGGGCHCGYACCGVYLSVIMDLPVGSVCACLSSWLRLLGDARLSVIVGMPVGVCVLVILA